MATAISPVLIHGGDVIEYGEVVGDCAILYTGLDDNGSTRLLTGGLLCRILSTIRFIYKPCNLQYDINESLQCLFSNITNVQRNIHCTSILQLLSDTIFCLATMQLHESIPPLPPNVVPCNFLHARCNCIVVVKSMLISHEVR